MVFSIIEPGINPGKDSAMLRFLYKITIFLVLGSLLFFIFRNSELINYGWMQGKGQIEMIMNTRSIDETLADPAFPDSLKRKLRLIDEIKKYAFDSIGIDPSKNYSSIYNQKGKPLMWVVTACKPFEIEAYEWEFPLLGKLSYKGFFIKEEAKKEIERLRKQGYDTELGTAGGWSTLGLFRDPVLSEMLRKKEGALSELIIHELTHGSVYISDSVSYNENLANFIGQKGAMKFLRYKYGKGSKEYIAYEHYRNDGEVFAKYSLFYLNLLQKNYLSYKTDESLKSKYIRKYKLLNDYVRGIDTLALYRKNLYKSIAREALQSKNAYFISFVQYESKSDLFEEEYRRKFNSDLKKYMLYLKQKYPENHFGF
jgi:predicted aminopeptidase